MKKRQAVPVRQLVVEQDDVEVPSRKLGPRRAAVMRNHNIR